MQGVVAGCAGTVVVLLEKRGPVVVGYPGGVGTLSDTVSVTVRVRVRCVMGSVAVLGDGVSGGGGTMVKVVVISSGGVDVSMDRGGGTSALETV